VLVVDLSEVSGNAKRIETCNNQVRCVVPKSLDVFYYRRAVTVTFCFTKIKPGIWECCSCTAVLFLLYLFLLRVCRTLRAVRRQRSPIAFIEHEISRTFIRLPSLSGTHSRVLSICCFDFLTVYKRINCQLDNLFLKRLKRRWQLFVRQLSGNRARSASEHPETWMCVRN